VLLTVGGENRLMPIMLDRHPDGTVEQRHDYYNDGSGDASDAFRTHGGLTWLAHSEEHPLEQLRAQKLDGMEIYNLHANIDPNIREDWLGLDGPGAIRAVVEFADQEPTGPEPDLALMSFLEPNTPGIAKWHALLGEGQRVSGSAGTDAHQNALPIVLRDGERGDSYRRMIRWFSNVALADDATDHASIESAIAAGRFFVAFELFGTPAGFDAVAGDVEIGGDIDSFPATLTVSVPEVLDLDPGLPEPAIRARILRIDPDGTATEVAEGAGPTVEATIADASAAAYRAEVLITPHHLGPYLGTLGTEHSEREQVWIYTNPFYVVGD
jgi:hypothetical protein